MTYKTASFQKTTEISVDDYLIDERKYKNNIYCPECVSIDESQVAELVFIKNTDKIQHFRTKQNSSHSQYCEYAVEQNDKVKKRFESKDNKDKEWREKQIDSAFDRIKNKTISLHNHNNNTSSLPSNSVSHTTNSSNSQSNKNYLKQTHIKRVSKDRDIFNDYRVIYGKTDIEITVHKQDGSENKIIRFKYERKICFSVYFKQEYFKTLIIPLESQDANFLFFGKLILNKEYINIDTKYPYRLEFY